MIRITLLLVLFSLLPRLVLAEVTILSADSAPAVSATPDREFACETLPWTDPEPGAGQPDLLFYQVVGATGPILADRDGSSVQFHATTPAATAPESGGTLEELASWGDVRIQSGTSIGRSLTPQLSGEVLLQDVSALAKQYLDYDPLTLLLHADNGDCLEADEDGIAAVACSGSARQQWIVDREGRLRTNSCEGEWACLVTPSLAAGAEPHLQSCTGATALPDESWAIEHWNSPVNAAAITAGIDSVKLPNTYWPVAAVEGTAVPLILADDGQPIMAVGSAGAGRVVAIGTWQNVCRPSADPSYEGLLNRLILWAGQGSSPVIGLSPEAGNEQSCLTQAGYTAVPTTPDNLGGVDIYLMRGGDDGAPASDIAHLEQFLRDGGGIIGSHHAFFYWDVQLYPPTDNLIAAVMARAGVAWSEDVDEAANAGSTLDLSGPVPSKQAYQISAAFEAFARHELGIESLSSGELVEIEASMPLAVTARALMTDISPFTVAQRALKRITGPLVIGPDQPFTWGQDATADMALRGDYVLAEALPSDRTRTHESAVAFPGSVAPAAPRVTRTVTIDGDLPSGSHAMWRSTGLYAAAGEVVTATFPPSVPGAGVFLQIGSSFDNVMEHVGFLEPNTIGRFPWVTAGRLVQTPELQLAGAFGGPLLISIPSGASLGSLQVEIEGAVEIPAISLDQSGEAVWHGAITDAPLVELQGENVIITMRSSVVNSVTDPVDALTQLDAMLAAEAELVGIDGDHAGSEAIPQRLVLDPFEVWGAHSGYPVHMTQSWDAALIDTGAWPGGSGLWAFLHEYGHNHQKPAWTLNHHGEVTCNILAVYGFETVLGLPMSQAWEGNLEPATMFIRTQNWINSGQPYSAQGYDVALYFFLYVKEAFGWDPFKTMYAEYRALPPNDQPNNEQEKIDQLAVRMSNATGHNLTDWFLTFRFPLSPWVFDEVDTLPPWDSAPF